MTSIKALHNQGHKDLKKTKKEIATKSITVADELNNKSKKLARELEETKIKLQNYVKTD